jgi:cell wall-associated NlpC family hydrolase
MKRYFALFTIALTIVFLNTNSQTITSVTSGNGAAYFSVTLQGTGLSGATAVKFNGVDAICFYADPAGTNIIALAPPGISTGPISVATPGGTVSSPTFTVVPGADPTSDFATIDLTPYSYETNWCNSTGGTWGPHTRKDFATPTAPAGVDAGDWARARIMAAALKWRDLAYEHHHIPTFDGTQCSNFASTDQVGPGLDCSNFTSFVYQYAFNYSIISAVATQASTDSTGTLLAKAGPFLPGDLMFCSVSSTSTTVTHVVIYIDPTHRIDEHSVGTYGCDIRPWNNAGVWPYDSWQLSRRPLDYIHYSPTTGIASDEAKNKNILIYPNPASNYLTISGVSKNDLITVYNYLGQHFIEKKVNNDSGIETFYINELKAGVYFIKINNKLYTSLLFQKL